MQTPIANALLLLLYPPPLFLVHSFTSNEQHKQTEMGGDNSHRKKETVFLELGLHPEWHLVAAIPSTATMGQIPWQRKV